MTAPRYTFKLTAADAFQLLDGLEARADAYDAVAEGRPNDILDTVVDADAEEAARIAQHYRDIRATIAAQMERPLSNDERSPRRPAASRKQTRT